MQQNKIIDIIPAFGLAIYIALMLIPLAQLRYFEAQLTYDAPRIFQLGSVVSFVILSSSFFVLKRSAYSGFPVRPLLLVLIFILYFLATSPASINPTRSFLYSGVTTFFFAGCYYFWRQSVFQIELSFKFVVVATFLCFLYLVIALPLRERTLGWISPNLLAHVGLMSVIAGVIITGRLKFVAILFGVVLIVFSQSRTVFISLSVFIVSYISIKYLLRSYKQTLYTAVICIFIAPILPLVSSGVISVISNASSMILGVDDASRVSGSGLSGRSAYWENALHVISERPLIGHGFRTRRSLDYSEASAVNAHSGFLNLVLDAGVLGTIIFIALYIFAINRSVKLYFSFNLNGNQMQRKFSAVAFSFLVAYIPIFIVEPNYMNLSHPTSMLFTLFVMFSLSATMGPRRPGSLI